MHLLLTDLLTCPRCGPGFGLILLAHRIEDRRVLEGVLGCANCREQYPIREGAGLFGGDATLPAATADEGAVMRIAAFLGVTRGPGFVLVAGPAAGSASALAELVEDVEVIASGYGGAVGDAAESGAEGGRVSRLGLAGRSLPLASGKVLGVALTGAAADALLEEGARVVSPVGRLVLDPAPGDAAARLAAAGLRVLAQDATTVVAART